MKIDEVVSMYIGIREERDALKVKHKEELAALEGKMELIEAKLLEVSNNTGIDSFKTAKGTAYVTTVRSCSVADKEVFFNFLKENELWHLADIRAGKVEIGKYKDANDKLPPGINWSECRGINVRKA